LRDYNGALDFQPTARREKIVANPGTKIVANPGSRVIYVLLRSKFNNEESKN
jgi:hypothetical protein